MSCCPAEIHVNDTPRYRAHVLANCEEFDISDADVHELVFLMPNGVVIRKDATITTDGSPPEKWYLEYQVQPGDGVGSPGEFHDNEGPLKVQGYVHFPDNKQFSSKVATTDTDGQELFVFPNL